MRELLQGITRWKNAAFFLFIFLHGVFNLLTVFTEVKHNKSPIIRKFILAQSPNVSKITR